MLTEAQIRAGIVKTAKANLGHDYRDSSVPYNWPPAQFDCSVFVHWCWGSVGLNPDQAAANTTWPEPKPPKAKWHKYEGYTWTQRSELLAAGCQVNFSDIQPGDALYYEAPGTSERHVVIALGGGQQIAAATTSLGVITGAVVPPGVYGHGGKLFKGAFSPVRLAAHLGQLASSTPPILPAPGAVTGLVATPVAGKKGYMGLKWNAVPGAVRYHVACSSGGGGEAKVNHGTCWGLTPGKRYFFSVTAVNSQGVGGQGQIIQAVAQ